MTPASKERRKTFKSTKWVKGTLESLKEFAEVQEAIFEIIDFIKSSKSKFRKKQGDFYEQIYVLRIKYEEGMAAAKVYQKRYTEMEDEFSKTFIENEISFKDDFDNAPVKEFILEKRLQEMSFLITEGSHDYTNSGKNMELKTRALYL